MTANDVIDTLADAFIKRGTPQFIRSDNGPEFVARPVGKRWNTWACRPPISNPAVHGKTVTSNHSMGSSGMNS